MDNASDGRLACFEENLRRARRQLDHASTDSERANAAGTVAVFEMFVDVTRGTLLPPACREALDRLVGYASDEWRSRNPEVDEFDKNVEANIEAQLLERLFHPDLDPRHPGLPSAGGGPRVIQGASAEDQSPSDDDLARSHEAARIQEDPAEALARWEYHLRMAQQRLTDAIAEHDHATEGGDRPRIRRHRARSALASGLTEGGERSFVGSARRRA